MTGNGTLTLTNTNTYVGATTIDAGTLVVAANGAMGPATAAGIVVNAGGALAFAGGVNYTTAEPITISGSGPAGNGAIENISGPNTFAVPITLSGAAAIGSDAGTLTLGGDISTGTSTLTVVGAGTTTIDGNIVCQGGSVTLADSGAINIAGNINLGSTGNLSIPAPVRTRLPASSAARPPREPRVRKCPDQDGRRHVDAIEYRHLYRTNHGRRGQACGQRRGF